LADATRRKLGHVVDPWLLSVAVIWGVNFVVYKLVLAKVTPLTVVGVRFGLMSPPLLLAAWLLRRHAWPEREHWPRLLWAGVVIHAAQQLSFILAVAQTTATEASLLITTMPLWTALIAVGMGQERLTRLNAAGVLAGFVGVALVVLGGDALASAHAPGRVLGDLMMVGSAALYGYFTVLMKPIVEEHGGLTAVAYAYALAAVVIVPVAARDLLATPWAGLDAATWFYLIGYISILSGAYGFGVWYAAVGRTSAARTAAYQYLVPVVAMASAALYLGERLHWPQAVGVAVTLVGLVMTRWPAAEADTQAT
jgi:drug/metabolite transporter (DMT)-like permease